MHLRLIIFASALIAGALTERGNPGGSADTVRPAGNVEPVKELEFPHVISIHMEHPSGSGHFRHFCSAAIISNNYAITAASCLTTKNKQGARVPFKLGDLVLVTGINSWEQDPGSPQTFAYSRFAQSFIIHPEYRRGFNDIALIRSKISFVGWSSSIPVAIGRDNEAALTEGSVTVVGWGLTDSPDSDPSPQLWKQDASLQPHEACEKVFDGTGGVLQYNRHLMVCVQTTGTQTCLNQESVQLLQNGNLIGISSATKNFRLCVPGAPTAFLKIAAYEEWLRKNSGYEV